MEQRLKQVKVFDDDMFFYNLSLSSYFPTKIPPRRTNKNKKSRLKIYGFLIMFGNPH